MIVNMASLGSLLTTKKWDDDTSQLSDNSSQPATGTVSRFRKYTTQYYPPQVYHYPPSQQPFPGAPQLYHHSPLNMTRTSQATACASTEFPSYGPRLEGFNLHQGGYGTSQMSPPVQIPRQGSASPSAPRVPPGLMGNNPVNQTTSSSSTPPPGTPSRVPGRPPISLQTKGEQPPADPHKRYVAGIEDLPPLPEISYDKYDAVNQSDY